MNDHNPSQGAPTQAPADPWMIDTVAISGSSDDQSGLNGDQFFSRKTC